MSFKISFIPDETYYKEAYFELVRFKRWEPILAILVMFIGIGIYCYDTYEKTIAFGLFCAGLYEFLRCFYQKNKWVKERMKSGVSGQYIEMEFDDEVIKHVGPFSHGEIKWSGLKEIKKTGKGIILKIDTGMNIYLPDILFADREQIEFLLSRNKSNVQHTFLIRTFIFLCS